MFHPETYAVPFKRFLFVNLIFTYNINKRQIKIWSIKLKSKVR